MLIRQVLARSHTCNLFFLDKRGLQAMDHSSLTAASRRSLDRVSVPVWGTFLSEPLDIVGLVGPYPANYLMSRVPVPYHRNFKSRAMRPWSLMGC